MAIKDYSKYQIHSFWYFLPINEKKQNKTVIQKK